MLAAFAYQGLVGVVGPAGVEMQAEYGAVASLATVANGGEQLLEIVEAGLHVFVVVASLPFLPSPSVEVAVGRVHDPM